MSADTTPRTKTHRRGPVGVSVALADALAHLESLTDTRPDDDLAKIARYQEGWPGQEPRDLGVTTDPELPLRACGVSLEHREAVRLFLQSWGIPKVRDALDALDGKGIPVRSSVQKRNQT